MRMHSVTAKLLAPLVIRRDRQSERSAGVRSVSGTLVRGALASIYLQHSEEPDDNFRHLFLNESTCRFGPLDPGPDVYPLTAVTCKRESWRHALLDQLWFRVAQHYAAGQTPDQFDERWRRCGQCEADLKSHEGFWSENGSSIRDLSSGPRRVDTHVGIDRSTGTAAESIFYTLEAMMPSGGEVDLYGTLWADSRALECLTSLLDRECGRISVGHARTRGYGDVQIQLSRDGAKEDARSEARRWQAWSRDLICFLKQEGLETPGLDTGGFFFSVSFPNGAVLADRFLCHSLDPADMVGWLPAMPDVANAFPVHRRPIREFGATGRIRWIAGVTRPERLRGWNAAHGLPRQDEWAVARGATYVYCFSGDEQDREALFEQLSRLSADGMGLRRNEGFGVALISDKFHRRVRPEE